MTTQTNTQKYSLIICCVPLMLFLWPVSSHAISLMASLTNLREQVPHFWRLITSFTYFLGMVFAVRAIFQFKQVGQQRMATGAQGGLAKPLTSLFIAVVFLYWPTVIDMMNFAIYNQPSVFGYEDVIPGLRGSEFEVIIDVAGGIIQVIGFISFIRGWILMARVGQQGAQPGSFAKAMMHIIGGLFAINIFGTLSLLGTLVGY